MTVHFDLTDFNRVMNEVSQYTRGYLDGFSDGGIILAQKIAGIVETALGKYIDSMARSNPAALHHVYEWGSVGGARLFEITAVASGSGVTVSSDFKQSSSISDTAHEPFYNKAEIMEAGIPITIEPRDGSVIYFVDNGEEFFINRPITISDPGGPAVQGSFERTFNNFFRLYFSQALLEASGFNDHLRNAYTFGEGLTGGYGAGKAAATQWLMTTPGGGSID